MLTEDAVKTLEWVMDRILEKPRLLNMNYWAVDGPCGTICCVAGWVAAAGLPDPKDVFWCEDVRATATRILGITPHVAQTLFFSPFWPEPFRSQIRQHFASTTGYACVTAARIRAFIDHYGPVAPVAAKDVTKVAVKEQEPELAGVF